MAYFYFLPSGLWFKSFISHTWTFFPSLFFFIHAVRLMNECVHMFTHTQPHVGGQWTGGLDPQPLCMCSDSCSAPFSQQQRLERGTKAAFVLSLQLHCNKACPLTVCKTCCMSSLSTCAAVAQLRRSCLKRKIPHWLFAIENVFHLIFPPWSSGQVTF